MVEIKAPANWHKEKGPKVFLAGSIDMGTAVDWQQKLVDALAHTDIVFLNPRRSDWDSSWKQDINNPQFYEQVKWELDGLANADTVIFYFAPGSMSPITLMELGLMAGKNKGNVIVCCPDGFYRKGNVDILCQQYGISVLTNIEALIECLK